MRQFSVILPTHNEMNSNLFKEILSRLCQYNNFELIIVNYGAEDNQINLLKSYPVKLVHSFSHLRATRLNQGIQQASNDWILLHHPRSLLDPEGLNFISNSDLLPKWGSFSHSFDDSHPILKFTSWYSNYIRGDRRGIYYLDHCLFFNKKLLAPEDITPVPELSIFEDTELCLKLKKLSPPQRLPFNSTTSSIRFKKNGYLYQSLLNQIMKVGYHLGVPDETMNRIYEKGLSLNSKY